MAEVEFEILGYEKKVTKDRGTPFWAVETTQGRMSAFQDTVGAKIEAYKGGIVIGEVTQKGNYKNLEAIYEVKSQTEGIPRNSHQLPSFQPSADKDKLIVAQVAYKLAVEMFNAKTIEPEEGKVDIHFVAKNIYKGIMELSKT